MPRKRALLIVNTRSRSGAENLHAATTALRSHGIEPVHEDCGHREDVSRLIVEHGNNVDLVAVGGGDGTMNAAALGVIETGLPLGVLPMGTANDLARTLGIAPDIEEAARVIADGHQRRIDLGLVNGHPFFNVASLGYGLVAIKVLSQARPFSARISSEDDAARVRTLQIAVGNGRYYGGGNAVKNDARIDDAHLDLYSLELSRAWKLALMARSFRHGEHGAWREVRAIRAREFDIRTRKPQPINADGEIVTATPAHFTIRPGAVTVFAPRPTEN
jgi:diacylglycerol kinase (ATP)